MNRKQRRNPNKPLAQLVAEDRERREKAIVPKITSDLEVDNCELVAFAQVGNQLVPIGQILALPIVIRAIAK